VAAQTAAQTWTAGKAATFTLAANTFNDPQGETLTLSAVQASGVALPSWLTFNASTRTFTGTPPAGTNGLSIKVTATDTSGLSVSETFSVATPAPASPIVTAQTGTQTWSLAKPVNFTLSANTFTDPSGETLTYTATQASGATLPSWLAFNAATRTFTGTPPVGTNGLSIKVTATDAGGASTSETFSVLTPASAPTVATLTAAQTWTAGKAATFTLAANTFNDPQGETLTLSAVQASGVALPSWLTFNASTRTFTGTPPAGTNGLSIKVTATDTSGLSVSETFSVATPAPASPTVTAQTANQKLAEGKAFSFTLASNTFTDPNAEALTLSASQSGGAALPSWLSFNASTRTFSGTAPSTSSTLSLVVKATDAGGSSVSETFTASIAAAAAALSQGISSVPSPTGSSTASLTQPPSSPIGGLASPVH
jgi:phage-related protein